MHKNVALPLLLGSLLMLAVYGCAIQPDSRATATDLDASLRTVLAREGMVPIARPVTNPAKVALGRALFFDKILSGNRNISCATCHLPHVGTGDALPLSIGEGGKGEALHRVPPYDDKTGGPRLVPRNAPDIFNRGTMKVMFWDGRVSELPDGSFWTPARNLFPAGVENALAAQAMFPVTSDTEMRGDPGENPLGSLPRWKFHEMWEHLMERLMGIEEYRQLFKAAYPDVPEEQLSYVHAANAIAEFEIDAFTLDDSPFDNYLRGDDSALSEAAKRGALVFYGEGQCNRCHSGPLFSDESFHCRLVPQIGPGKTVMHTDVWDYGRGEVTGKREDLFTFRTPPLRNVAITGPWMHDGAYTTFEAAVRHEINPFKSATSYDPSQLPEPYRYTYHPEHISVITDLRWELKKVDDYASVPLDEGQIQDLIAFLASLTSPSALNMTHLIPDRVPSGLPVRD